jgi:flagellar FliL protein
MARESEQKEGPVAAGGERPGGNRLVAVLGLVTGLAVGGLAGAAWVGPKLVERLTAAPVEEPVERKAGGRSKEGKGGGEPPLHMLENLVVNPAESQGLRFLIVTLAIEVDRAETAAELAARDAEVRDALVRVLGSKTVAELADVASRGALKEELATTVSSLLSSGKVLQIYLPQFVIQ